MSCRVSEKGAHFCSKASPSSGRRHADLLESTLHARRDQVWTQPLDHQGVLLLSTSSKGYTASYIRTPLSGSRDGSGAECSPWKLENRTCQRSQGGGQERISGREAVNDKGTLSHARWMTNTEIVLRTPYTPWHHPHTCTRSRKCNYHM